MVHLILLTVTILSTFTTARAGTPLHLHTHIGTPQAKRGGKGWTYGSGIQKWSQDFSACDGSSQSPIALKENMAEKVPLQYLRWFNMNTIPSKMRLFNNGHTVVLKSFWPSSDTPYIELNQTGHKFILDAVHWHWGNNDDDGTEHEVEGRKGALEMHMVFRRSYGRGKADTLVYSHLFEHDSKLGAVPQGIKKVAKKLDKARYVPEDPSVSSEVDPAFETADLLVPPPTRVFFYSGSQTTPPCLEPVLWLVNAQTGFVGDDEINAFRQLKGKGGRYIAGNIRPLQPRNGRKYQLFAVIDRPATSSAKPIRSWLKHF